MSGPLTLALSPLRGARGPESDDVRADITAELAANDNAVGAANDNRRAHRSEAAVPEVAVFGNATGAVPTELEMQNVTREIALDEDEAATGWRGLALLVLISIAAHAALFGGLGG